MATDPIEIDFSSIFIGIYFSCGLIIISFIPHDFQMSDLIVIYKLLALLSHVLPTFHFETNYE